MGTKWDNIDLLTTKILNPLIRGLRKATNQRSEIRTQLVVLRSMSEYMRRLYESTEKAEVPPITMKELERVSRLHADLLLSRSRGRRF